MAVSSKSIIHYTGDLDTIKKILESGGLRLKYCSESVTFSDQGTTPGIFPMVCFCDLPLTLAKEHIDKYGSYGLGFSKEWAHKNQLNPVLYIEKDSSISLHLLENIRKLMPTAGESLEEIATREAAIQEFARIMAFCKNHAGQLIRRGKLVDENYIFYDEREWRFVPSLKLLGDAPLAINSHIYNQDKDKQNEKLTNKLLKFHHSDISYIIVKSDQDIPAMANFIHTQYSHKIPLAEYQHLYSKIISVTQIRNDF